MECNTVNVPVANPLRDDLYEHLDSPPDAGTQAVPTIVIDDLQIATIADAIVSLEKWRSRQQELKTTRKAPRHPYRESSRR